MRDKTSHRAAGLIKKNPDVILFDWDDTLFDQAGMADAVYHQLLNTLGREPHPTSEELRVSWYKDKQQCCDTYFPGSSISDVGVAFDGLMRATPMEQRKLLPQAEEVLKTLHAKGIPMAIVSNKPEDILRAEIDHLGLTDYFQVISGAHEERSKRKPNPHCVDEAIRVINEQRIANNQKPLRPNRIWMVGDSLDDAHAAEAKHIQRIHIGEEHSANVRLSATGEDLAGQIIYLKDMADFNNQIVSKLPDRLDGRSA